MSHNGHYCAMPVLNSDIARSLEKLADLIELEGGNPFRIRAYRNAARVVGELLAASWQ
jgi:DNA polymerase (family 10)